MTIDERICTTLKTGENNAVSLAELCCICNVDNRELRYAIEHLRRHNVVICSSNKGYFYPADLSELSRYVRKENARSNSIETTLQSAKKLLAKWGGEV